MVFQQIVNAFKDLNAKGIVHRDIKLPNIMVHFPTYKGDPNDKDLLKKLKMKT